MLKLRSVVTGTLVLTATMSALASFENAHAETEIGSSVATTSPPEAKERAEQPSAEGFYPIWESTGYVAPHREAYIGTNGAHFGIRDTVQLGLQPINFMYRSPNLYAKYRFLQRNGWHVSAQLGGYYLMEEASRSFLSPMYSSRLDNPDFTVILLPASVSATLQVSDWMDLHQTATLLGVYSSSGVLETYGTFGYTAVAEFKARARHSVLLHAGEVGFWNHDLNLVGASYRYHNNWMEFRLGYFYRMTAYGAQNAPLIGFGVVL